VGTTIVSALLGQVSDDGYKSPWRAVKVATDNHRSKVVTPSGLVGKV
jgi:hypothetical protein